MRLQAIHEDEPAHDVTADPAVGEAIAGCAHLLTARFLPMLQNWLEVFAKVKNWLVFDYVMFDCVMLDHVMISLLLGHSLHAAEMARGLCPR